MKCGGWCQLMASAPIWFLSEQQPILFLFFCFFRKILFLITFFFFFLKKTPSNNDLVSLTLFCCYKPVIMCVCACVRACVHVIADPAFNSCRDPGTPAYGIPVMAQGFQVRMTSFLIVCTWSRPWKKYSTCTFELQEVFVQMTFRLMARRNINKILTL